MPTDLPQQLGIVYNIRVGEPLGHLIEGALDPPQPLVHPLFHGKQTRLILMSSSSQS